MITQQSHYGGLDAQQGDAIIHLSDDDIARLIQVRFCFEQMSYDDLIWALTLWQKSTGIKQISYEKLMLSLDQVETVCQSK